MSPVLNADRVEANSGLRSMKRFWILNRGFCLANRTQIENSGSNIRNRPNGFTLLEIIIVILILSVLTGAAIPMVRNTVRRERESDLRLALRQLRQAIDRYKLLVNRFRTSTPHHRTCFVGSTSKTQKPRPQQLLAFASVSDDATDKSRALACCRPSTKTSALALATCDAR